MNRSPPLHGRHRPRRYAIAVVPALALAAMTAHATIYKCELDDGSVTYQETPCPPGRELRDFDRDPPSVSVVPFRIPQTGEPHGAAKPTPARAPAEHKSGKRDERQGNAAERKFLVPGVSEGEVVARVGRPDLSTPGGRKTVRWTYLPAPDDPQTVTTLTFEFGRLIEVERKVVRP